jgi:hypothetical protein
MTSDLHLSRSATSIVCNLSVTESSIVLSLTFNNKEQQYATHD